MEDFGVRRYSKPQLSVVRERKVLFRGEAFFEVSCGDQFKLSSEEYIVMSESYYIFNRGDILSAAENN